MNLILQIDLRQLRPLLVQVVPEVIAQEKEEGAVLWAWAEVVEACGTCRRTFERQERDGSFGPTRVTGKPARFYRREVLDWLAAGRPRRD
jgi:hypothetical protein